MKEMHLDELKSSHYENLNINKMELDGFAALVDEPTPTLSLFGYPLLL